MCSTKENYKSIEKKTIVDSMEQRIESGGLTPLFKEHVEELNETSVNVELSK